MNVAIIGSRSLNVDITKYIPPEMTVLISGGAIGIDSLSESYADKIGIEKMIFLPDYDSFGKRAPLERNKLIVDNADYIVAIWNGYSRGTRFTIDYALNQRKEIRVYIVH